MKAKDPVRETILTAQQLELRFQIAQVYKLSFSGPLVKSTHSTLTYTKIVSTVAKD